MNPTSAKRPPSIDVPDLFFWRFLTNKQTVAEKSRPWAMPLGAEDGLATNGASGTGDYGGGRMGTDGRACVLSLPSNERVVGIP